MRMEVAFERAGDAWLPLFRPAAEQGEPAPLPADEIEPGQIARHVRPMATAGEVRGQGRDHRHRHVRRSAAG